MNDVVVGSLAAVVGYVIGVKCANQSSDDGGHDETSYFYCTIDQPSYQDLCDIGLTGRGFLRCWISSDVVKKDSKVRYDITMQPEDDYSLAVRDEGVLAVNARDDMSFLYVDVPLPSGIVDMREDNSQLDLNVSIALRYLDTEGVADSSPALASTSLILPRLVPTVSESDWTGGGRIPDTFSSAAMLVEFDVNGLITAADIQISAILSNMEGVDGPLVLWADMSVSCRQEGSTVESSFRVPIGTYEAKDDSLWIRSETVDITSELKTYATSVSDVESASCRLVFEQNDREIRASFNVLR